MKTALLAIIPLLAAVAGLAGDPAKTVLEAQSQRIAVMAKAKNAVLAIFSPDGAGGGSGVVISADGYALTNFHVVRPCGTYMKCGMADGRLYDAVIVGVDPTGDTALIKLFGRDDFPCATLGDSDQMQAGDWVFAMGNPFLLATDFQPTVTYGILSGVHRYQYPSGTLLEYTDCLQTDASINPGNSGGPLFDSQGRLIGINGRGSFEKRGRVCVGVGYAISINQIKNFLGALRGGLVVDHATLVLADFDAEGRVIVSSILEESDPYRRGLRYGDELISFGGRAVDTPNGYKNILGVFPKGWRIPLSFRREGKRHDILVRLQGVHAGDELFETAMKDEIPGHKPGELPKDGPGKPEPGPHPIPIPVPTPGGPIPHPGHPILLDLHKPKAPLPEIVKTHFEEKHGYANYYFNKLNRDRVWKGWTAHGSFADLQGPWLLSAHVAEGGAFQVRLTADGASLKAQKTEFQWRRGDPLAAALVPPGSGGLLLALHLWRRLAVEGPAHYGEVSYLGTAPLAGVDGLVDVLSAIDAGVECRFMFHPASGDLLALELVSSDDADPCEIRFSDYRQLDGRALPQRLDVRCGDDDFGALMIDSVQFEKTASKP